MTAAVESPAPQSTILDIHTSDSTDSATAPPPVPAAAVLGLPFRASADPDSTHVALSAYLTSFGFLSLLLFAGLNMRMLSSPSLSTEAGERSEYVIVFCCYSLCLMLVLLFLASYLYCVMSGGLLRAKPVLDSDRVLLDGDWLHAQQTHRVRYERADAVSVWSIVRGDHSVRPMLTFLLSSYCCLVLVWRAASLSTVELLVLVLIGSAVMTAAALTNDMLACLIAFVVSDWLELLTLSLLHCPSLFALSEGLLLAACQLLLCILAYVAARVSSSPATALLFSSTFHSRLLLVSPSLSTLVTVAACIVCSLTLHRMARQPQSNEPTHTDADTEDDADISEEIWRVRQFVCMSSVYAAASNGARCVYCLLGDGLVPRVLCVAALLLFAVREYKLRERHKQV